MSAEPAAPAITLLCPDGEKITLPPSAVAGSTFFMSCVADTGADGTAVPFIIDIEKFIPGIPIDAVKMAATLLSACEDALGAETAALAARMTQEISERRATAGGVPVMPAMQVFFFVQRFADVFDFKALYREMIQQIAVAINAASDAFAIYEMCGMTPDPTWDPERPDLRDARPPLPKSVVRARLIAERNKALAAVQGESQPMDVEAAARADADLEAFERTEIEKDRAEHGKLPVRRADAPQSVRKERANAQGGASA